MTSLRHSLMFLGKFLRKPGQIAAVWPSSRFLAARMFQGFRLDDGDAVLEFGPGTGAFTAEVDRLRRSGIAIRYLGIEREPDFHRVLTSKFPDLDFEFGDVADVRRIVAGRGLAPVKAVYCGLPLISMPVAVVDEIFDAMGEFMHSEGVFRTFSYVHSYPTRGAVRLRRLMRNVYGRSAFGRPVLRNVPPAYVLSGYGRPELTASA